jgi:hypothetical protein
MSAGGQAPSLGERLYRFLLQVYPPDFRDDWGDEMLCLVPFAWRGSGRQRSSPWCGRRRGSGCSENEAVRRPGTQGAGPGILHAVEAPREATRDV